MREWTPTYAKQRGSFVPVDVDPGTIVRIHSLLFDGVNNVAAGRSDGKLTFWDYHRETQYMSIKASDGAIMAMDWLGDVIVSAGADKIAHVWNLRKAGL